MIWLGLLSSIPYNQSSFGIFRVYSPWNSLFKYTSTGNPSINPLFGVFWNKLYLSCTWAAICAVTMFLECVLSVQLAFKTYLFCLPQPKSTLNLSVQASSSKNLIV